MSVSDAGGSIVRSVGYVNLDESVSPSYPRGRRVAASDEVERLLFIGRVCVKLYPAPGSVFGK